MKISDSAYMGVEVLMRLAPYERETPCTLKSLAKWINRSLSYTETLMARLRAAGLVRARHGPGGGYYLTKPADQITVAEIFKGLDEPRGMNDRPLNAITLEPPDTSSNRPKTPERWWMRKTKAQCSSLGGAKVASIRR